MIRLAALLSWFLALGFGLPGAYGAWYFAAHGDTWTLLGFPTYGGGPFENAGIPTSAPLLIAFVVVCVAELVIGALLWSSRPAGVLLSVLLLPIEMVFWIGFALPLGPILGVARTGLAASGWLSQRPCDQRALG